MPDYRAMVIFENASGIPEDRFVNTFYWRASIAGQQDDIFTALEGFYNSTHAPGTQPLRYWLSPVVNRGSNLSQVRVYDLADPEPREPTVFTWTLGVSDGTGGLPNEVACVASFFADRNLPRARGRIYFGPLTRGSMSSDVGDQRVGSGLRNALLGACQNMANLGGGGAITWMQRSTVTGALSAVTGGWIDDAFDTQRRRGQDASNRITWPIAV